MTTRPASGRTVPRIIVAGALAALVIAIIAVVASSPGPGTRHRAPAAATRQAAALARPQAPATARSDDPESCAALWNAPSNVAAQRAFAGAAGEAGAGTTVERNAFVSP